LYGGIPGGQAEYAVGRISDRNSTFSSGKVSGTLNGPVLALGTRTYSKKRRGQTRQQRGYFWRRPGWPAVRLLRQAQWRRDNPLRRIVMVVEVYRDRAIAPLREVESVIVMIDEPTAWQAVKNAEVKPGSSVAIFGAGPVGLLCASCARLNFTACQAVGRISDRNSTFSSGKVSGTLNGPVLALGYGGIPGGQAEYVRVPKANTGPFKVPDTLPDEKVANRAGAKNSHAAAGFDLGVFYRLPGGRQNI
jgi:hypothetical protein